MDLKNIINSLNLSYEIPTDRESFINWCKYNCDIEVLITSILNNLTIPLDIRLSIVRYLTHNKCKRRTSISEDVMEIIMTVKRDIEIENKLFLKEKNRERKDERKEIDNSIKKRRLNIEISHIDLNNGSDALIIGDSVINYDLLNIICSYLDLLDMRYMRAICKIFYKAYTIMKFPILISRYDNHPGRMGMHLASYALMNKAEDSIMVQLCNDLQYNICLSRDKVPNNSKKFYMDKSWTLFDAIASYYTDRLVIPHLYRIPSYPLHKNMKVKCISGHCAAFNIVLGNEYNMFHPHTAIIYTDNVTISWCHSGNEQSYEYIRNLVLHNQCKRKQLFINAEYLEYTFPNLANLYISGGYRKSRIATDMRNKYKIIDLESLDDLKF